MDYDSNPVMATFTAGSTSAMVNVPVTVDDIVEGPETFDLSFTIPSSLQVQIMPGMFTKAAAIIDDNSSKKNSVMLFYNSINIVSCYSGI